MEYFEKVEKKPEPDLTWNLPEQRWGTVKVIGGNSQRFHTEVKTAEFLYANYPVVYPVLVFPDSLKDKLPELPKVIFIGSTESGSFGDKVDLDAIMAATDYNLLLGDLSKNAITAQAIHYCLNSPGCPTVVTRDAVDLIAENEPEEILLNPQVTFLASMPQLQKLFRAVYYPKMLLMTQSLVQVADALHKFTLSYPCKIVTLHNGQILIAEGGIVKAVPLEKSGYQPLTFWNGEVAAKIVALNLFNPKKFIDATLTAILHKAKK